MSDRLGIYLMNSVNPFRLEGQKTIMFRVLEAARTGSRRTGSWCPAATSAIRASFGKAFIELKHLGLIDRVPRLAVINAFGAHAPFPTAWWATHGMSWLDGTAGREGLARTPITQLLDEDRRRRRTTIASAIEINRPVNLKKCLRALDFCDGVVRHVSDQEIMDAKARVGAGGLGCEPA